MANNCGAKILAGVAGGGMLRMRVMASTLTGLLALMPTG
mgnify:CR=1 FL=1